MPTIDNALLAELETLKSSAQDNNHRYLVVISGDQAWCDQLLQDYLKQIEKFDNLCISNKEQNACKSVTYDKANIYIGCEFDTIIYDAYSGFFPSAFALAEGMLKGGGLMLLMTPSLDRWSSEHDAFSEKYAMHPYTADQMSGHFIKRLVDVIKNDHSISILHEHEPASFNNISSVTAANHQAYSDGCLTLDQHQAVKKIIHSANGHRNRPLVMLSNRGHGKSSALGIACAQLLQQQAGRHITITGPRKIAANVVFEHAARVLEIDYDHQQHRIVYQESCIEFIAPDELIRNPIETSLLMVDEAASLPLPILESLLQQYHRIIFSSTVYGYEGSGRGFELKFFKKLDELANNWHVHRLDNPVRWNIGDPLEDFCFKAFLLQAILTETVSNADVPGNLDFIQLRKEVLLESESMLSELFGLLSSAHYKTTPNDLRMILDSPYIDIFCLKQGSSTVACALISTEGGIDENLANDIANGYRRVYGQLLPQTLMTEHASIEASELRHARIMRIAVHPLLQGMGVGSQLLDQLRNTLSANYDVIGASFGGDARLLSFWDKAGYVPVKVGHKKNAYSGYHSLLVVKGLSEAGKQIINNISEQYPERFLFLLSGSLRYLEAELAYRLLLHFKKPLDMPLSSVELKDLNSFAHARRSYDCCAYPLYKLFLKTIHLSASALTAQDRALLLQRLVQRQTSAEVIDNNHLNGKAELLERLRLLTAKLLNLAKHEVF